MKRITTFALILTLAVPVSAGDLLEAIARAKARQESEKPATKPVIIGNSIPGCLPCEKAKRWKDLPFTIVWRDNPLLLREHPGASFPIFEFPQRDGRIHRLWGYDKDKLIAAWALNADTDKARYSRLIAASRRAAPAIDLDLLDPPDRQRTARCKCGGRNHAVCMCLKEIRAGLRKTPCGCSRSKESEHFIDDKGRPTGPTGRYFPAQSSVQIPQFRRVC